MTDKEAIEAIKDEVTHIERLLLRKNQTYGNSLQNPVRGLYKGSKVDGILARLDDKYSRLFAVGINDATIDTVDDIIGYLIHLKIAYKNQNK